MTTTELLQKLLAAETSQHIEESLYLFSLGSDLHWRALGRENNRGTIEASGDPARSAVERVTNAIDAVLDLEHSLHHGLPECKSPFDAARSWLGVPPEGLAAMSQSARQALANRVTVTLKDGTGKSERMLEIRDAGTGIAPEEMSSTILSLNESNKIQKFYLSGAYGQGGSSTFAFCKYSVIISRAEGRDIGFTIVKYDHLNPDLFKTGHYVFLTDHTGKPLTAQVPFEAFPRGTVVRHIAFDLSSYPSPFGPRSLYGALNTNLFDPVLPIWLDSSLIKNRRVIKGARNALNGAIDAGDQGASQKLSHKMPMFTVSLGDAGTIGIEYWVLPAAESPGTRPSDVFVNSTHPIILTLNGQNGEFTSLLIRKHSELPFLSARLICHIDCNNLSATAKRLMFVSNREGGRDVLVREMIRTELIKSLKSDDVLTKLNEEARRKGTEQRDENALKTMRSEVAKLLQLQGIDVNGQSTEGSNEGGGGEPPKPRPPRPPVTPILPKDPPTYVSIKWPDDKPITFYPAERRYIRVETDASSAFYSNDLSKSRLNIILPPHLAYKGSTPLVGGRMRFIIEAAENSISSSIGELTVELSRPNLPTLRDQRNTEIVPKPEQKGKGDAVRIPLFDVIAVHGPEDPKWGDLGWDLDVNKTASEAVLENGTLNIYYSTAFPRFAAVRSKLETHNPATGASFVKRYEIWLVAHSLLFERDQEEQKQEKPDAGESETADAEAAERRRLAIVATMMAAKEVTMEAQTKTTEE